MLTMTLAEDLRQNDVVVLHGDIVMVEDVTTYTQGVKLYYIDNYGDVYKVFCEREESFKALDWSPEKFYEHVALFQ